MKNSLIVMFVILAHFSVNGQQLKRKVALGAYINQTDTGMVVTSVEEGTAVNCKLKVNDVLFEINQQTITDYQSIKAVLSNKRAGDLAEFVVIRKGKKVKLSGKFEGRPLEKSLFSDVIYDEAPYKNGQLRVIINRPIGESKLPAMLFIPGYTCSSIDNLPSNHPYKRIIDTYVKAGFVTLRIEKSGLGDSDNTPSCESCDLYDEIENFEVGLKKLKSLPYVDTSKIIIVGHSMGGIIAPALSSRSPVAGVVVYGTTAKSWFEYQIEMYRVQNLLAGMEPLEYEQSIQDQYELNYRFFVKKESLDVLAADSKMDSLLRTHWMYDGAGNIFGRNGLYWRQIQDVNHIENWKNTKAKVLVQFGESDFQAFSKADHQQIVRTVNYYNKGNATLQVFENTDHYYAKSGTMQEAFDKFNNQEYEKLFDEYNIEVGNGAVKWSLDVINITAASHSKTASFSWKKLNTVAYPGKQDDITFINEQTGWYVNGLGSVYKTTDGGQNWLKIAEKKGSFFRTIAFLNDSIGFLGTVGTEYFPNVTDTIPLYKTTDGGINWKPVNYRGPYVKGLCAIDIVKEPYINHGVTDYKYHIYAVGRVGSPANIMISHDGGETWISSNLQNDCKMLFDIKMMDKNVGFVCAASHEDISQSNAMILKTEDGGKSWKKVYQSNRPYETSWKISFPTPQVGYATIQSYNLDPNVKQQRIAKTVDGGTTWTELNLVEDAGARQFGIGFIDRNVGYVGTMNSGYETKDGGQNWTKIDLGQACNKIRIYKSNNGKTFGYAIGVNVLKLITQ